MTALFPQKSDTLTARNIVDSFMAAYEAVHSEKVPCEHLEGRWFLVNGMRRDRHWVILEIERLRQEAFVNAMNNDQPSAKGHIFKMIRRLSRI